MRDTGFITSSANEASQWWFPKLPAALMGLLRRILSTEEGMQRAWTASQCWYVGPICTDVVMMQTGPLLAPAAAPPHTGAPSCLRSAVMRLGQLQCIRSDQGSGKVWDVFRPSKRISMCFANWGISSVSYLWWNLEMSVSATCCLCSPDHIFLLPGLKCLIHNLVLRDLPKSLLGK